MLLSRYRPWIFTLFVVLFGATASLVLFYAFGYRYSFERGIFIFSGSVTVKTLPEAVDIAVDGEPIPRQRLGLLNNSVHIAGLMPGEHTLRLTAPEHAPWEKRVVIESGISREFWNIILPRNEYPLASVPFTETTTKVFPHPSNDEIFILVKSTGSETSLVLFNFSTGTSRQVFSLAGIEFDPAGEENLEWSWFEDGRYVILPAMSNGALQHLVIDTRDGSYFAIEERYALSGVRTVRWNTDASRELLFLAGTTLYRLGLDPENQPLSLAEDTLTYSFSDDTLYLVGRQGEVWEVDGNRLQTITPKLPLIPEVPVSLTVYERDRLALLEEGGERRLWLLYPNPVDRTPLLKQVGGGIMSTQFSNDGKKLLFATANEIGVVFANEWEVQPRRQAGDIVQVARFSETIENVQWAENYEHILFSRGGTIKFIELDGRDYRVIADIATLPTAPTQVLPHFSTNQFLVVVPGTGVQTIVFPEPQSLFGQ